MAQGRVDGTYKPNAMRAGARFDRDAASRPILIFEDVFKAYRADQPVLRGTNLVIERGEFVFITGPSGAGKSTLLRLLYRAETVDDGRILFQGRDVARLTPDSIPMLRRNVGVVFQDFKLVPHWTVFHNVAVALEVLGLPSRLVRARVGEALERVGLGGRGEDRASVLSGGEQQRVSIARAIVGEPAILLADEPTGNLDPQLALDVLGLFEDIHETGTTVLFATHDRTLLEIRRRRVVVLDEGKAIDVRAGLSLSEGDEAGEPGGLSVDRAPGSGAGAWFEGGSAPGEDDAETPHRPVPSPGLARTPAPPGYLGRGAEEELLPPDGREFDELSEFEQTGASAAE